MKVTSKSIGASNALSSWRGLGKKHTRSHYNTYVTNAKHLRREAANHGVDEGFVYAICYTIMTEGHCTSQSHDGSVFRGDGKPGQLYLWASFLLLAACPTIANSTQAHTWLYLPLTASSSQSSIAPSYLFARARMALSSRLMTFLRGSQLHVALSSGTCHWVARKRA